MVNSGPVPLQQAPPGRPSLSDPKMALAAVLVQLAPQRDWNTEQHRRTNLLTVLLSPQSWTVLYTAARIVSDQPEGEALRQQVKQAL